MEQLAFRSDNSIFNPTQLPGSLTFSKVPFEVTGYDIHFHRKAIMFLFPALPGSNA